MRASCRRWLRVVLLLLAPATALRADTFTYVDKDGQKQDTAAKLVASASGVHVLALPDGQYKMIPEGAIVERRPDEGPAALTPAEMAQRLEREFGKEKFRVYVKSPPFVMGLVLETPLPKQAETRTTALLKKGAQFMTSVSRAFTDFVEETRVDVVQPEYPLVVLIFETDSEFEKHAAPALGGGTLSAGNVSGFYSGLTNRLSIRLAECRTFDVPLHEAIHQQVYNRGVFNRLAPVPHWFDEGIATGFEANNGRITVSPVKISTRYAKQALEEDTFDWKAMATNDKVFQGDVLASEAYGQAWGLHWLLVTKYRSQYGKYLRTLAAKEPLSADSPEQRLADFREAVGHELPELEQEFLPVLSAAVKRQKVVLEQAKTPGLSLTEDDLGKVEMSAVRLVDQGGRLQVEGNLANVSPLRNMTFHVTVETDIGTYAEWVVPDLPPNKTATLGRQFVLKAMQGGGLAGSSRTFRVKIRSTPADSGEAKAWREGNAPVPVHQP